MTQYFIRATLNLSQLIRHGRCDYLATDLAAALSKITPTSRAIDRNSKPYLSIAHAVLLLVKSKMHKRRQPVEQGRIWFPQLPSRRGWLLNLETRAPLKASSINILHKAEKRIIWALKTALSVLHWPRAHGKASCRNFGKDFTATPLSNYVNNVGNTVVRLNKTTTLQTLTSRHCGTAAE